MTTITILPRDPTSSAPGYRAISGDRQSEGETAGKALDALTDQLPKDDKTALIVLQRATPDEFFTAEQQARLQELMSRWRNARANNGEWGENDQRELEALVRTEVEATAKRAAALLEGLQS